MEPLPFGNCDVGAAASVEPEAPRPRTELQPAKAVTLHVQEPNWYQDDAKAPIKASSQKKQNNQDPALVRPRLATLFAARDAYNRREYGAVREYARRGLEETEPAEDITVELLEMSARAAFQLGDFAGALAILEGRLLAKRPDVLPNWLLVARCHGRLSLEGKDGVEVALRHGEAALAAFDRVLAHSTSARAVHELARTCSSLASSLAAADKETAARYAFLAYCAAVHCSRQKVSDPSSTSVAARSSLPNAAWAELVAGSKQLAQELAANYALPEALIAAFLAGVDAAHGDTGAAPTEGTPSAAWPSLPDFAPFLAAMPACCQRDDGTGTGTGAGVGIGRTILEIAFLRKPTGGKAGAKAGAAGQDDGGFDARKL